MTRRRLPFWLLAVGFAALACRSLPADPPAAPRLDFVPLGGNEGCPPAQLRSLPINLPTALRLVEARSLDVALASERIRIAEADLTRSRVLWLPTLYLGGDYTRHDGQLQDVVGNVFSTNKSSVMAGGGASAVFAVSDALFAPLSARQVLSAQAATRTAALNDTTLAVAEAYFTVQQARGELAGALDAQQRAEELLRKTTELAKGLVAPLDVTRAQAEVARRRQLVHAAVERQRVASAELARLLRLDPAAVVEPLEPPDLQVTLVPPDRPLDDLIALGLTQRPELAAQQALVQATLERLRQERLRPLVPSILIRGNSTNPSGTLAGGYFGGGINDSMKNFSGRIDYDVQVLWELQNLGLGNRSRVQERRAENQIAMIELFRTQDRIAAEVAQAHTQVASASAQLVEAQNEVRAAVQSADDHVKGIGQTQRVGALLILVIRPQEVVASIGALGQAYNDYARAVGDYDRAQFRLYRALGQPAALLAQEPCKP
jgi:outer membrane protein TolC